MKSPDVNPDDQVIRDRRNKHIAEDEGGADHEGGWRDHREGAYEGTRTRHPEEITLQVNYALSSIMHRELSQRRVRSGAQVKDAPDDGTCTAGCEPRVQMCNCQERESVQVYKSFQRTSEVRTFILSSLRLRVLSILRENIARFLESS